MIRHPPRTTRSDPLFPYRTPVRATEHEALRLRVGEVPPGDRSPRPHRHPLCELDAGVGSDIEQLTERPLLGVLGAGLIAGCRTDAAILLRDQVLVRKALSPVLDRTSSVKGKRVAERVALMRRRIVNKTKSTNNVTIHT